MDRSDINKIIDELRKHQKEVEKQRKQLADIVNSAIDEKNINLWSVWCAENYKIIGLKSPVVLSNYVSGLRSGKRTGFSMFYNSKKMDFTRLELERFPKIIFLLDIPKDNPVIIAMEKEYPDFKYPR